MAQRAPGTPIDLPVVLASAAALQEEMEVVRNELKAAEVEGSAGGGVVRIKLGGDLLLRDFQIDLGALSKDDNPQRLAELVEAAWNEALRGVQDLAATMLGGITAGGQLGGGL